MKESVLLVIFLLIALTYFYYYNKSGEIVLLDNKTFSNRVKITILYDNYEFDRRLKTGFGFSCLIEVENKSILFDTGGDSPTLLDNMKKLGIDPQDIDLIVLSHIHGDHVGGLFGILKINPNVTVYIPKSFPTSFKNEIKSYGADYVEVSNPTEIFDGVYTTGELGTWIKEQSLIIKTEKGLIIITGCAHPGIVNIVKKAKELTGEEVYLVVGGFHYPPASVAERFKELGVKKVAPSHCTGENAMKKFEEVYGENFIRSGVGRVIA
ncbi:MBL fold metallo-hydrolase [Candidatus Heimdallarchaeota archaeon]|nr:MAG: MBL fold metallo-hydrolase [Candidatus Heimdallarchaeota archaeon]